jgi:hypothetical protein
MQMQAHRNGVIALHRDTGTTTTILGGLPLEAEMEIRWDIRTLAGEVPSIYFCGITKLLFKVDRKGNRTVGG